MQSMSPEPQIPLGFALPIVSYVISPFVIAYGNFPICSDINKNPGFRSVGYAACKDSGYNISTHITRYICNRFQYPDRVNVYVQVPGTYLGKDIGRGHIRVQSDGAGNK